MSTFPQTRGPGRAEDVRFRIIFDQSPISTQIFSTDGNTIAVNRAWEQLWGVTLEQISEYNILQDQQLVDKGVMPYIRTAFAGEAAHIPAIKYEPDQTIPGTGAVPYRWVRAFIYPVKDEHGVVREVVLTHEDITDQRRAEEALRESEARFRAMFEGAPIGISLLDAEGRYLAVNPARLRMLGYSEEELVGQHFRDVTHEEDIEYDRQVNAAAREHGDSTFQLEKRFVRADGSVAWTRVSVSMVPDRAGKAEYFIALAEDITARKRAEEERAHLFELERAARQQLEQLAAEREAVLGQIAEGIIIADPEGRITFVNEAARALHGVAELGVSVEGYADTYHLYTLDGRPYPPEELTLSRAVLKGETVVNHKVRIRRPDGTDVVAEASATPVVGSDGRRLGAVLSVRDITAEYDLQRQKDEFLSSVAHDLRTPLTTIKGRIQLLQRRKERGSLDAEMLGQELEKIDGNVTRMIALISELLDVANIQMGRRVNLVPQEVDLVSLVRDVVHEQRQATESHIITFRSQVPELKGVWDAGRVERVLANLISNALKYSPNGGQVSVEVEKDEQGKQDEEEGAGWAVVHVRDEGIGIPAADLPHIFERFHRAENVAGRIPGTGIGLAAAQEIVEQHGGSISVQSQEGVGSTFSVRLPLGP